MRLGLRPAGMVVVVVGGSVVVVGRCGRGGGRGLGGRYRCGGCGGGRGGGGRVRCRCRGDGWDGCAGGGAGVGGGAVVVVVSAAGDGGDSGDAGCDDGGCDGCGYPAGNAPGHAPRWCTDGDVGGGLLGGTVLVAAVAHCWPSGTNVAFGWHEGFAHRWFVVHRADWRRSPLPLMIAGPRSGGVVG